jgi:predicted RNase H-like nuclease
MFHMTEAKLVAGVDGCPAGWIVALWDGAGQLTSQLCASFADVMALPAEVIAVDMPIGLPERSGRPPEREVRARLGQRQSSVFAVPSERAIYCADYREACAVNLRHSDPPKKVSKQCFHLFPKMREIDSLIAPHDQSRIFESHPELAFWVMNGETSLALPKKVKGQPYPPGLDLRRELLRKNGLPVDSLGPEYRRRDVGPDDLLDACACTFVAWRILNRRSIRFPADPPLNAKGLRMEINA